MKAANYPQLFHHNWSRLELCTWATVFSSLSFALAFLLSWVLILENVRGDGILSPALQRFSQLLEFMRPSGKQPGQQCIKNNVPEVDRASYGNARMV